MTTPFARWQSLIQVAPTNEDVIALVRRYMGTLSEAEVLRMPRDCRPTLPTTREEVSGWAVEMVRAEMQFAGDPTAGALLHQMSVIFAEATTRFAQLAQEARMLGPSTDS
jgi:hypothetical protein